MHLGESLIVLGALLVFAYILGRLGKLIGLPAIPIYMIVGLLASPHTGWFPLDFESANIELVAIFGLVLLLFNLGLEFDQDEFFGNAGKLLLSGGSYILLNMAVGIGFGFLVGWGAKEALIIGGITATSSSAIVTKLLIELGRLTNKETPMILGITVVEDVFIAIYLAIVGVVLSGETEPWPVILKLVIAFTFIVAMFAIARYAGKVVGRLFRTKDDELFTILFFGLAVLFGGIGEELGVTDAIGAFLIGLVLGATRYRNKIEGIAAPLRDVFGAFFFLNFGLALDASAFGDVLVPVLGAILMTMLLNVAAGQFVSWLNGFDVQSGINTTVILQNRGEFGLILATLSLAAGLDERIQSFAGLYVLIMAIVGPILATQSERIGRVLIPSARRKAAARAAMRRERPQPDVGGEADALMEGALAGAPRPQPGTDTAAVTLPADAAPMIRDQDRPAADGRATQATRRPREDQADDLGGTVLPQPGRRAVSARAPLADDPLTDGQLTDGHPAAEPRVASRAGAEGPTDEHGAGQPTGADEEALIERAMREAFGDQGKTQEKRHDDF